MSKKRPAAPPACIEIRGAWQNNLKGFDLDLPLGKLIVVTGPSGSGKSSLAFDTVYAEGQRRYVETFSPYTRQFLDRMDKPRVDEIRGIPPAIAIGQSNNVKSTRSTVGTMTDINDYLKLLFPLIATAHCPKCERTIQPESARSIVEGVMRECAGATVLITFGVAVPANTKPADFFAFLQQQGYLRVWIDGGILRTDEPCKLKSLPAKVSVIQDRITLSTENRARLTEAVETALRLGSGKIQILIPKSETLNPFSTGWHCAHCDLDITPPSPGLFSFNNPLGACPTCRGFGRTIGIDLMRAIPDRTISIAQGCIKPFTTGSGADCQRDLLRACREKEVSTRTPFDDLPHADQQWLIHGEDWNRTTKRSGEDLWNAGLWYGVAGYFRWLESKAYKMHVRVLLSRYRNYTLCPDCHGGRYQPAALNFRFAGKTLPELQLMPVGELCVLLVGQAVSLPVRPSEGASDPQASVRYTDAQTPPPADASLSQAGSLRHNASSTAMLFGEITSRLGYLVSVGLGYLSLDRPTRTLSGGECERVNLTTCLGANLVNTLFVLDEPSIGLHPRDTGRLIRVMQSLRDKGNTLLVVEHEEAVMRAADHVIELGPGRGEKGGQLVFAGPLSGMAKPTARKRGARGHPSLTQAYLTGEMCIPIPPHRRTPSGWLKVEGACAHNLRDITVEIPLGVFACVTGVSGSGKSTLVHSVLYENLLSAKGLAGESVPGALRKLAGVEHVSSVVLVDQSPLSRTPKSTPAVYLGVFDHIRELFAQTPRAVSEGLAASAFSFNGGAGRCERCGGAGAERVEMQFLSDVFIRCPECEGRRYQPHILKILLGEKSIHDVLEMSVSEAIAFFERTGTSKASRLTSHVVSPLRVLEEVGLGYLRLGQPLNVLSGGESQRLKLVERLTASTGTNALLILDEPTTGLHFDDIAMLLRVFERLVAQGNSLLVIEHNLEVIKCADHIIDLGPEAGVEGGLVVATGTPEQIAACDESHTGRALRPVLGGLDTMDAIDWMGASSGQTARVAEDTPFPHSALRTPHSQITIHGAREHNLRIPHLAIPRDQLVVITGLSGSGKSTLAFDLLFAEGQRRFLDVMSPYARQFVQQLEKPDVDLITGLPPSVAIEQRITRGGGKSTVATVTEVYHFLRLLFAKLGTQHCPDCGCAVEKQTAAAVIRAVEKLAARGRVRVFATLIKARKGFHTDVAKWAKRHGFDTLLVDARLVKVAEFKALERFREHTIEVLVERGTAVPAVGAAGAPPAASKRAGEIPGIVKHALEIGKGTIRILDARNKSIVLSTERACPDCGRSFEELDPRMFSFNSPHGWCAECRGFGEVWKQTINQRLETALERELDIERQSESLGDGETQPCPQCLGARLNPQARAVRLRSCARRSVGASGKSAHALKGAATIGIAEFTAMPVQDALAGVEALVFSKDEKPVARDIIPEIAQRLTFMGKVGLDYLALGRSARTLSGGESQRIRLAAQLGSNLRGVLYVLDEPTIGLHPRDNAALLDTLDSLKAKGNSLVVVEHDEDTMRRADTILDLGPGAGMNGGLVVATGTLAEIMRNPASTTGRHLRQPLKHPTRGERRNLKNAGWLELRGAKVNNLKNVTVRFPIARLSVITGISGSGKSTLMRAALKPAVTRAILPARKRARDTAGGTARVTGADHLEAIREVDQSPIGKTTRSTPATYLGVWDEVRALFAQLPVARMRGYTPSRFSFNTAGGRCETCAGQGVVKMEMAFLPTSYHPCPDCHGARFNPATLEVLYNGKSIGDVLRMPLAEAAGFFEAHAKIHRPLALLGDTGLGYLQLGQPSPTLSGGEAQRMKLVYELALGVAHDTTARLRKMREPKSTLYLLEEPTIGLHMHDVAELLKVLHRLVDNGATIIVIEHNMSLIADADYVVDIGPEAGANGGEVVACGTPEEVSKSKRSQTAPYLRPLVSAPTKICEH